MVQILDPWLWIFGQRFGWIPLACIIYATLLISWLMSSCIVFWVENCWQGSNCFATITLTLCNMRSSSSCTNWVLAYASYVTYHWNMHTFSFLVVLFLVSCVLACHLLNAYSVCLFHGNLYGIIMTAFLQTHGIVYSLHVCMFSPCGDVL